MDIEAEFVYADILRTLQSSILGQPSPSVSPPAVAYWEGRHTATAVPVLSIYPTCNICRPPLSPQS